VRAIPGTCASDGRGEDFVGFLCGARLATGVHFGEIVPQLTRIALAADVNTLAPGAGRIPGTSVLAAVLARRAVSAQPFLPTYLVIFGLTAQPGGKKAMVPREQTIADGELTFRRRHKNRLYRLARLRSVCVHRG
jgi:hypothetical protein